jgi:hypothetical protein
MHLGLFRLVHGPVAECLDGRCRPDDGEAVGQAAGGLHQAGGGQVGLIHHHPRGKAHEAGPPVGLDHDDAGNAQLRIPQQQHVAHGQVQRFEQGGVHPDVAARRDVAGGLVNGARRVGHPEAAAQRVARRHALERDQLRCAALRIAGAAHGGEPHGGDGLQAQRLGAFDECGGRRVVAGHHGVATQQLQRIALQATLQPVGKKAHRCERGHRQRHSHDEQPQLARAQVTRQGAPAKA